MFYPLFNKKLKKTKKLKKLISLISLSYCLIGTPLVFAQGKISNPPQTKVETKVETNKKSSKPNLNQTFTTPKKTTKEPNKTNTTQKPAATLELAYKYFDQGLVLNAISTFKAILEKEPSSLKARLGLALAEEKQGLDNEAIASYEEVLKLDPNQETALTRLSTFYSRNTETLPKAIEQLKKILALKPKDKFVQQTLAEIYKNSGQLKEAKELYLNLLSEDQKNRKAKIALAQITTWQGLGVEALPIFNEIILEDPTLDEPTQYAYALACFQAKNYSLAKEKYLQLVKDYPDNPKYKKELEAVKVEITLQPRREAEALFEKARKDFASKNYTASFQNFEMALTIFDDAVLRMEYADLLSSLPEQREKALTQLTAINPQTDVVTLKKARILSYIQERREQAFPLYLELYNKDKNNKDIELELCNLLSWIELDKEKALLAKDFSNKYPNIENLSLSLIYYYLKTDQPNLAQENFDTLLAQGKDKEEIRLFLANSYIKTGQKEKARQALDNLLKLYPNNLEANQQAGFFELSDQKPEKALFYFNKALEKQPNAKDALVGRAETLMALGRPIETLKSLKNTTTLDLTNDVALKSLQNRAKESIASSLETNFIEVKTGFISRTGNETITINKQSESITKAFDIINSSLSASVALNPRFALETNLGIFSLDDRLLGNFKALDREIKAKFLINDFIKTSLAIGQTIADQTKFLTRFDFYPSKNVTFFIEGSRLPIMESFFSYSGVFDSVSGKKIGRVMANGFTSGLNLRQRKNDFNVTLNISRLTGKQTPSNNRQEVNFSFGHDISKDFEKLRNFKYFRSSIQFSYLNFERDLNQVTIFNQDKSTTLVRGYFSPNYFVAIGGRGDFNWQSTNERLQLIGGIGLALYASRGKESRFFKEANSLGVDLATKMRYAIKHNVFFTLDYHLSTTGSVFRSNQVAFGLTIGRKNN